MKLTEEQKSTILGTMELFKSKKIVTIGGVAGVGKTVIVSNLSKLLPKFAVCAFTGKAANVLQNRSVPARTIHSLIYKPMVVEDKVYFTLSDSLDYDGIIVDEASMISKEIFEDITSFDLPIIFVGDHAQLEPIGKDINLMKNPDFKLETIHRNAGEIAHFADYIRKGYRATAFKNKNLKSIKFINKKQAEDYFDKVDQIICAYNKTRVEINNKTRIKLGLNDPWPYVGEKLMCLRNNHANGLFNGMQGKVIDISQKPANRITFESNDTYIYTKFDPAQLNKEKYDFTYNREDPDPFDYCYAITAHKSQGSEWEKVMVFEQICNKWDHVRWAYTAASRAKQQVVWVS